MPRLFYTGPGSQVYAQTPEGVRGLESEAQLAQYKGTPIETLSPSEVNKSLAAGKYQGLTTQLAQRPTSTGFMDKLRERLQKRYDYNKDLIERESQLRKSLFTMGAGEQKGIPATQQARTPQDILGTISARKRGLVEQLSNVQEAIKERRSNLMDIMNAAGKAYKEETQRLRDLSATAKQGYDIAAKEEETAYGRKWKEDEAKRRIELEQQLKALGLGGYYQRPGGPGETLGGYTDLELRKLREEGIDPNDIKAADAYLYGREAPLDLEGLSEWAVELFDRGFSDTEIKDIIVGADYSKEWAKQAIDTAKKQIKERKKKGKKSGPGLNLGDVWNMFTKWKGGYR